MLLEGNNAMIYGAGGAIGGVVANLTGGISVG
jgi:hypothetical protein